jgi:multicomponent Na+:H+ antiporter subunit C
VNLLLFAAGGLREGAVPFIGPDETTLSAASADPLPQALILTAIVISFGVLAFTLAMVHRADKSTGSDDLDDLKGTDA